MFPFVNSRKISSLSTLLFTILFIQRHPVHILHSVHLHRIQNGRIPISIIIENNFAKVNLHKIVHGVRQMALKIHLATD